ncbi:MAG: hypothetical protein M3O31_13490 [Acidobacteriota bacterium]|nr:hypothetical protein [Acidobacteriota bacterium]
MNRRDFVAGAVVGLAAHSLRGDGQQGATAKLEIDATKRGPTIPGDFTGLSYESAQLANPEFFSAGNKELIALFRGLSPSGNLRLGGGSSEFTTYSDADPVGPPPFEVFGPDTSKTVKHGTVTTALALRNLRAFLDATGWSCLYGLNLGQGTKENAVAEAVAVTRILGPRLMAFQIGNEPDSFRNRYRPATWGPADYMAEWNRFHNAIAMTLPGATFAGPDISNKLLFLTSFAEEAPQHKDVILLTAHYYAMGPAGNPDATLEQLADPNPKLATMKAAGFTTVAEAMKAAGLPFRMSEGNSCWDGGKPGVSDTLASALWCADMMLRFAQMGWCGVNLHGGGNGFYTPITGAPSTGFTRRPEYCGIEFGQSFAGAQFVESTLTGAAAGLQAYAFLQAGRRRIAMINKTEATVNVVVPKSTSERAMKLSGPSLASKDGITFRDVRVPRSHQVVVPAHSGMIYEL